MSNNISAYNIPAANVPNTAATQTAASNGDKDLKQADLSPQQQQNAMIIESVSVTISSKTSPMPMLNQSVISKINEALEQTMGHNAIQNAYTNGVDVSPEATADRITSYATNFYGAYRNQHPEMDDATARSSFVDLMSNAVDQGFDDAKKILDGLGVLKDGIAKNIDETYNLVQDGFAEFLNEGHGTNSTASGTTAT
jgi:hypothetical protein